MESKLLLYIYMDMNVYLIIIIVLVRSRRRTFHGVSWQDEWENLEHF